MSSRCAGGTRAWPAAMAALLLRFRPRRGRDSLGVGRGATWGNEEDLVGGDLGEIAGAQQFLADNNGSVETH